MKLNLVYELSRFHDPWNRIKLHPVITKALGCDTQVLSAMSWNAQVYRWVQMHREVCVCVCVYVRECSAGWMQQHLDAYPLPWAEWVLYEPGTRCSREVACGVVPGPGQLFCPGRRCQPHTLSLPVSSALTDVWLARRAALPSPTMKWIKLSACSLSKRDRVRQGMSLPQPAAYLPPSSELPYCQTSLWIRWSGDKS